jgi:hypothetical protein
VNAAACGYPAVSASGFSAFPLRAVLGQATSSEPGMTAAGSVIAAAMRPRRERLIAVVTRYAITGHGPAPGQLGGLGPWPRPG